MATTADIRNGLCIELNGDLYIIIEFLHVKPGKGAAFVRTKIRNIKTGKVLQHTFPAGTKINVQRVERRPYQFLYKDENGYNFMHVETFEQTTIEKELINAPQFLKEGQIVDITFHADTETPILCELPPFVELEVKYSEPGIKGDTATNAMKPAILETGAQVFVPLFVNVNDIIKIDTRSGEYSERLSKAT